MTAVLVYAYIKVRFSFESVASIYLGVAQPKHALHHALEHNVSRSRSRSRRGSTFTASSVISLSFRMVIRATANKSLKKKDRASNITRTTRHCYPSFATSTSQHPLQQHDRRPRGAQHYIPEVLKATVPEQLRVAHRPAAAPPSARAVGGGCVAAC